MLFFYPKDGTAVCTKEACSFRDAYEDFVQAGAAVIGVSSDSTKSHQAFAGGHQLPFVLLSDADGSLHKAFGVPKTLGIMPGRVTYVIDKEGSSATSSIRSSRRIGMLPRPWPWFGNWLRVERSPYPRSLDGVEHENRGHWLWHQRAAFGPPARRRSRHPRAGGQQLRGRTREHRFIRGVWLRQYAADTGFMVFNDRTYPNFVRMLQMLEVPCCHSDMSFSVRRDQTGLEYQGSSLSGLFAQRRNLVRPSFYRMLLDVLRFNRQSLKLLQGEDFDLELGQYLDRNRYSREFIDHYLIPMGAAIWSAAPSVFGGSRHDSSSTSSIIMGS